jgi:tetratricopeptide (TPR) repeat protein
MPRSQAWWLPGLLSLVVVADVLVGVARAEPTGTVELNDGRKWEHVEFEVKGDRLYVKFPNNMGGTDISMAEVKSMRVDSGPPPGEASTEGEGDEAQEQGPTAVDWEGRFRLEPPDGWAAAAPTSPLMRVMLHHKERDATFAVYLRQVSGDWTIDPATRQLPREVQDDVTRDLTARYARSSNARVTFGTLFDTPVVRVEGAQVVAYGSTTQKKLTELRFRRFGIEYALAYTVTQQDEGALAPGLDALFRSFSFLPAVTISDDEYGDYGHGLALSRPNADWTVAAAPFDDEQPVRLSTADGRAEVLVQLRPGADAEAVLRALLNKRQQGSRYFTNSTVSAADQGGVPVKRFQFNDVLDKTGRKILLFKGLSAAVGGQVAIFTGMIPQSDVDAKKLEGEVDSILAGVRLWDPERLRQSLSKAQDAMAFVSQGSAAAQARRFDEALQKYDQAVQLFPGFARALYLRALAKKELHDFDGSRADLEQAAQLDPSAGYDAELAVTYDGEAKALEDQKNWAEALKIRIRIFRSTKNDPNARKVVADAQQVWSDMKKDTRALQLDRSLTSLERDLRPLNEEAQIATFLATTFREGAQMFMRDKNFSKAKKWAQRAQRVTSDANQTRQADQLLTQIQQQEEQARNQR